MSKNYEIECAIVELEKELVDLKKKKLSSQENQDNQDNQYEPNIPQNQNQNDD